MLAVVKNCKGRHLTISDATETVEDSFVVGCIIEEKRGSKALNLKKFILSEVLPNGDPGKMFALFVFGIKSILPAKVDDVFVIHNPNICKSHLINHLNLLNHKYEYEIIVHKEVINIHNIAEENKQVIELLELEKLQQDDVKELGEENESQSSAPPSCKRKQLPEKSPVKVTDGKRSENLVKKIKLISDSEKDRCSYTKLSDIISATGTVNLIGIIKSVVQGTLSADGDGHMKIYLQDDSVCGSEFQLNLLSNMIDVPPLHCGYILRAQNVWIQKLEEHVVGWVRCGKLIATVESDMEKPITLLTTQADPKLTDRICNCVELDVGL